MEVDGYTLDDKTGERIGYVYVVQPKGHNVYKIGSTIQPEKRIKTMKRIYHTDLIYLAIIPYPRGEHEHMEQLLQLRFKKQKLLREWFLLDDEHIQYFKTLERIQQEQLGVNHEH